jgi:hypothetical protein
MIRDMEKFIKELRQIITFKDSTERGDIVLIAAKTPPMLVYALVTSIERDTARKDEWWHVGLSLLMVPPQQATWTLRTSQMTGMEVFTMGGEQRFVKAVDFGVMKNPAAGNDGEKNKEKGSMLKRVK